MRKLTVAALFTAVTLCTTVHTAELKESFSYGINYAWKNYSGDFGGISAWGKKGVASDAAAFEAELNDMASNGIEVVRWWIWPEFWNDAVTFDSNGVPNQLGQNAIDDALKALELVDKSGMRVMFCIFSFDGFRPTRESFGITMTGYRDILIDDVKRAALMSNVVQPLVAAIAKSPHISALHSWDVINEPEWAMTGTNKYGGNNFEPSSDLEPITHDQMEVFVSDTIKIMRRETPDTPITIGSAAVKWMNAWNKTDIDFYQPHIYDWVNDYWPYSKSPSELGFGDKPMIMGEYPVEGLAAADHKTMLDSWFNNGYAGALGWDYRITHSKNETEAEMKAHRDKYLKELKEFASANDIAGANNNASSSGSASNAGGNTAPADPGEPAAATPALPPLSKPGAPVIEIDGG